MRNLRSLVLGVALALPLLAGCHLFNGSRRPSDANVGPTIKGDQKPSPESLVNYLNQNSKRITSLKASLDVDARQGLQSVGISGNLGARRPRELRLTGKVLGSPVVDVGSNNDKFWYWIGKTKEDWYVQCRYQDLATGKVNVPFPVEADMVMAALNLAEYDPKGKYELNQGKDTWELVQDTTSAAGQPIKRTTVFRATLARSGEPQVIEHAMRDAKGNLVCRATVQKVESDRGSGAVYPTRLEIEWPSQKVRMKMMLSQVQVNRIDDTEAARMFSIDGVGKDVYDLAKGSVITPSSMQRARNDRRR